MGVLDCKSSSSASRHSSPSGQTNENPACSGGIRVSGRGERVSRSGRMRCLFFYNVFCLRPFLALHDFKLNVIAFLQALVTFRLDGAIVNENVRTIFPADKTEALGVVEPLYFTFDSRHVPYSERPETLITWTFYCSRLSIATA